MLLIVQYLQKNILSIEVGLLLLTLPLLILVLFKHLLKDKISLNSAFTKNNSKQKNNYSTFLFNNN